MSTGFVTFQPSPPNPDQRTGSKGTESRREKLKRRADRRDSSRMGS